MHIFKRVYISPALSKEKKKLLWRLKHHVFMPSVYVVTLAAQQDLLEIYHSSLLKQKFYRENPPFIVGIAESHSAAVAMIQEILMDVLRETGGLDIQRYCRAS
ncbi:MAG: hypothetical protein E7290_00425 [Lachnospiraceae bacterium]|nr:hypothetical protein [Lachnospiraceae bacterium]